MTKNRAYKFHEIIEYLEIKHIAVGTKLVSDKMGIAIKVVSTGQGLYLRMENDAPLQVSPSLINDTWRVKEALFYLKAPKSFGGKYLNIMQNVIKADGDASENIYYNLTYDQGVKFTQQEIDNLDFDVSFFSKEEVEDND